MEMIFLKKAKKSENKQSNGSAGSMGYVVLSWGCSTLNECEWIIYSSMDKTYFPYVIWNGVRQQESSLFGVFIVAQVGLGCSILHLLNTEDLIGPTGGGTWAVLLLAQIWE